MTASATANHAPTISGQVVESVHVGETYNWQPVAADQDGDALHFSAVNLPGWASIDPTDGHITGTPGANDVGIYESITVTAADGAHRLPDRQGGRRRHGDGIRDAEKQAYMALIGEVAPLEGARELILELRERDHTRRARLLRQARRGRALRRPARRARPRGRLDQLRRCRADQAQPDLILAAIAAADDEDAVMVGDSAWDCRAAKRAKIKSIGVLSGGFSDKELLEAGASAVYESIVESSRPRWHSARLSFPAWAG